MIAYDGFVLAGGSSSRMGQDKAFLEFGGRPLVFRACDALADSNRVLIVGGDGARFEEMGLSWVPDCEPGAGPVNGLITALTEASAPVAVVLGCDLTTITRTAVDHLVMALGDAHVGVPIVDGRPQWMASAWRASALPTLRSAFDRGERAVHRCVRGLRVAKLLDTTDSWYRDADIPADINRLEPRTM